jgi:hypothetical protein
MSWWWPFKRREAAQAEQDFREMLDQALLRQDDLQAATERLQESRRPAKRALEEPSSDDDAPPRPNPRPRNV